MNLLTEVKSAIDLAGKQTNEVENRAISLLYQRGCMCGLTCEQQSEVRYCVREELLKTA